MNRTIQLDEDAYDRLEQARGASESHSEVIRRCVLIDEPWVACAQVCVTGNGEQAQEPCTLIAFYSCVNVPS